jgi:glycerol-3-phosphate acyltransferase PlsY
VVGGFGICGFLGFVLKVNKIKIMLFFTVTLLLLLLFSVCGLEVKICFGIMQPVFYILNSLIFYRKDFAFKMNEVMLLYNILGD